MGCDGGEIWHTIITIYQYYEKMAKMYGSLVFLSKCFMIRSSASQLKISVDTACYGKNIN